jgi:hypothetical protein
MFPTTTTLYAIDADRDVLVVVNPPNAGVLNTVGPLGVDTGLLGGFDIAGMGNVAYAVLTGAPSNRSRLYAVNLATGAATLIGNISGSGTIVGIAIAP